MICLASCRAGGCAPPEVVAVRTTVQRELHLASMNSRNGSNTACLSSNGIEQSFAFLSQVPPRLDDVLDRRVEGSADFGERVGSRRARSSPSASSQAFR